MPVKLIPRTIKAKSFTYNSITFIPDFETSDYKDACAVFTHGYTASKSDCLSWAQRLSENGVPVIIFDQPGHYLGSFNDFDSFDDYKDNAHTLFIDSLNELKRHFKKEFKTLILGGHSLGGLLSLKANTLEEFQKYKLITVGVGVGISQHKTTHLFESSFYEKTLNIRGQLVTPALAPSIVFPWIKEEKIELDVIQKRIHLITGQDDVVVGAGGQEALVANLEELGNIVTMKEPKKLPHHEPSLAAAHIYAFLKEELNW